MGFIRRDGCVCLSEMGFDWDATEGGGTGIIVSRHLAVHLAMNAAGCLWSLPGLQGMWMFL